MIKKPWTPDNCPLQVGSVVHDPSMNTDRMVIRRHLNYEDNCADEEKQLVLLDRALYSGKELMENGFTYYPDWPDTSVKKPCCNEVKEEPDIAKLAQSIFNGLIESKYAVEGVHYTKCGDGYIWQDDIHDKVSDVITELIDNILEEVKHDEQQ